MAVVLFAGQTVGRGLIELVHHLPGADLGFPGLAGQNVNYLASTSSVVQAVVNPPVTMNVRTAADGNLVLTWPQGVLLEATNITGPWRTNDVATSPFTNQPTEPEMFYRVQVQ